MNEQNVFFLGDIHANFSWLSAVLRLEIFRNSSIIQVGDFGLGFLQDEDIQLQLLNESCLYNNVDLKVIRGNHDKPNYFKAEQNYSNIQLLEDYSILNLNDFTILLIGGAISVDRISRSQNVNYWKEEEIQVNPLKIEDIMRQHPKIDIVVTHTAPNSAPPYFHGKIVDIYRQRDRTLLLDIDRERSSLSSLLKKIETCGVKLWIYGHFHLSDENNTKGVNFVALNINEFVLLNPNLTIKRIQI